MKYILMAALTAGAFAFTTVKKDKGDAWINLFDGKTTTGWHTYLKPTAGAAWKVENGTLHLDPSAKEGRGDLVTDGEYENFDLKYEWKISEGGNSGVIFDVKEDPKYEDTYMTGPEMQVLDNDKHPDGKIPKHRAGNLYDLIQGPDNVKPVGDWNKAEIICNHGSLKFYLNGVNVVTTTMWDDNWKNMVANSKFKQWPDFGTFKKGHIALQDHGNNVWYKNIAIKLL
ncbi:MAG TPA: DUF1080 domain-containing protein [Chitinophagaceae bacterium]|nr:DUF1080 domain-containing protein [Chitinophagaceae bacterium]